MIHEPAPKFWSKSNDLRYMIWSPDLNQMIHDTRSDSSSLKQWTILLHNNLTDSEFRKAVSSITVHISIDIQHDIFLHWDLICFHCTNYDWVCSLIHCIWNSLSNAVQFNRKSVESIQSLIPQCINIVINIREMIVVSDCICLYLTNKYI